MAATLYTSDIESGAVGSILSGWTGIAGSWQVTNNFPVSASKSFSNTANADGNKAVYTSGNLSQADQTFRLSFLFATGRSYAMPMARCNSAGTTSYLLLCDGTSLILFKQVSGAFTVLRTVAFPLVSGTGYTVELSCVGSTIAGRIWATGSARPVTPTGTVTDSAITSGTVGLYWVKLTGANITGGVDDFLWEDPSAVSLTTLPVDSSGILWSPYNWDTLSSGDFGVSVKSRQTTASGAYLRFSITGAKLLSLALDATTLVGFGASTPRLMWSINFGAPVYAQISEGAASLVLASGLTPASTYSVQVWVFGFSEATGTRWGSVGVSPTNIVRIQGVTADTGAAISSFPVAARTKRLAFYGDSIVEGVRAAGTTSQPLDHARSSAWFVGQGMAAEFAVLGYGASGWETAGSGAMPALPTTWANHSAGRARDFTGIDYLCVMHGYNGTTTQSTVQAWIAAARAVVGATCWIFVINAPSGRGAVAQAAAVAAYLAANPTDKRVANLDYSDRIPVTSFNNSVGSATYEATDGVHPMEFANAAIAASIVQLAQSKIDSLASGSVGAFVINAGGVGITASGSLVSII